MGTRKEQRFYKGKYYQGTMSDDTAEAIITLVNEYKSVASLRHCIKDTPDHVIMDMKNDVEEYEKEHGNLEGFSKDYSSQIRVGTLNDMQTIGVAFMYYAWSALLGDEVGLGKTVQVAGLANVLRDEYKQKGESFRFCFLTEKSSIGQIRDKLMRFTGEYIGMLESAEKSTVDKYLEANKDKRYYSIVGGHSLLNNSEFLISCAKNPFDLVIIDESYILKNTSSDYYINCKALFKYHKRKILLNATPLETEAREFYNQLDLLDSCYMPTVGEFNSRYCKKSKGMFGYYISGYKLERIPEFKEAISLRYLARTREGEGATYDNNVRKTILVPLSEEQKVLMRKTTLYQMVTDYPTGVNRNVPFNTKTTPKLAALLRLLDSLDIANDKALIYCRFVACQKAIQDILTEKGYRSVVLNGQCTSKVRTQMITDFNNGAYDIMITNVQKGIDLNECNNSILYTIDPNPMKMVQFEGRTTREFNVRDKSLFMLVAMGKEKKFVEETLKIRVEASNAFTNTGRSMVLESIQSSENKQMFEE